MDLGDDDLVEQGAGLAGGLGAARRVLVEQPGQPGAPGVGAVGHVDGVGADQVAHQLGVGVALEADLCGEPLGDDQAQAEQVGVGSDGVADGLLGGGVARGAQEAAGLGLDQGDAQGVGVIGDGVGLGQAEVDELGDLTHLGVRARAQQDVLGLDVAVQDLEAVGGLEGLEELMGHGDDAVGGGGPLAVDDVGEAGPTQVLHDQKGQLAVALERVGCARREGA